MKQKCLILIINITSYKDKGVQVLAVNVSESELAVNKFAERHNLDFPIVIDKDGQVQTAYGIDPLPATFLIDKNGKVVKYSYRSVNRRNGQGVNEEN